MQTSLLYVLWNRNYCPWQFYIAGMGIFNHYSSCDIDLDSMTLYKNLTRIPWRYTGCANMNLSYRLTDIHTDRHD